MEEKQSALYEAIKWTVNKSERRALTIVSK